MSKASLMIVDDESLARYSISVMLSRNFDGIRVVAEAENGRQALELAREFNPQIIIMDVKMPGMNGVEASRKILEVVPQAIVLLASAHDSFQYAQQAIDIGVFGYVLKPIQEEEFVEKIRGILNLITSQDHRPSLQIGKYSPDLISFMEEEFIALLLGDNPDVQMLTQFKSLLEISRPKALFLLLRSPSTSSKEITEIEFGLKRSFRAVASRRAGPEICFYITPSDENETFEAFQSRIENHCAKLQRMHTGQMIVALSEVIDSDTDAGTRFSQTYKEFSRLSTENSSPKDESLNALAGFPFEVEESLIEAIHIGDEQHVWEIGQELVKVLGQVSSPSVSIQWALSLIISIEKALAKSKHISSAGDFSILLSELSSQESVLGVRNRFSAYIEELNLLLANHPTTGKLWMEKAVSFLKKNIYQDISVEIIADSIGLSPQHLSRLFKEQFNQTVGEYILRQRMSYAQYLLSSTTLTIGEISEKTGYTDQNYFARVFKKSSGLTPSSYRHRFNA